MKIKFNNCSFGAATVDATATATVKMATKDKLKMLQSMQHFLHFAFLPVLAALKKVFLLRH